jgi:hypothetical protein
LIHEELSVLGFTPKGIVLPVSAFILANLDQYTDVLEQFSRPPLTRTKFDPLFPEVTAGAGRIAIKWLERWVS